MHSKNALHASDLSVGYGGPPVVEGVTVEIPADKITAFIGPNGCGKSTLLHSLGRQLHPSHGVVQLGETDIRSISPREYARQVAFLPQQTTTPEGVTVREVISYGRYPYTGAFATMKESDYRAIARAAAQAGVTELLDTYASDLSGGQRQRVWVAMAVAQETPILLLDEPTTYLDPAHQIAIMDLVLQLKGAGRTIVMVLHDMTHAARFADHIVAMRSGQIIASGATEHVMTTELVRDVFGIECLSVTDPATGRVLPIPYR